MSTDRQAVASKESGASRSGGRAFGWLRRLARLAILSYLGVVLIMLFLEKSLIFFPAKYPEGFWDPEGLEIEDAHFTTARNCTAGTYRTSNHGP
jgi:hypothetical protein